MKNNESISLLELDGQYIIGINNDITFSLNNEKKFVECKANNIYKLADPVLNQIFKAIFSYGNISNQIAGEKRLTSFLNDILYSKYKEKIVSIEYLPNGLVKPNQKSNDGRRVGDIVLKANFENGRILFIDIEIQTSFYQKIFRRWVEYSCRLFSNVEKECLILVLQVDDTKNNSFSIYPIKKDENPFMEEKIEDTFEIVSINIKRAISLIKQNKPIQLGDIDISEEGKNWLKIIGIRYWIQPFDGFYILPGKLSVSPEIQSAINLLSLYTPEELVNIMDLQDRAQKNFEDGYYTCEEEMKEKNALEVWMDLFTEGMTNKLVNKLNKVNKVREENVRKLYKDEPELENFIKFLSQNGKLV